MSLLSENVIPGNHGKVFETNAETLHDLIRIQKVISKIEGVKDVMINESVFPKEITIHTTALVSVKDIEEAAKEVGLHVLPKDLF